MKINIKKIKFNVFKKTAFVLFVLWITGLNLSAENLLGTTGFSFEQNIKYPGGYTVFANIGNNIFEGNFGAKIDLKTLNDFKNSKLMQDGFALRFTPVLYQKENKYKPALSFFLGRINSASILQEIANPIFSVQRPSSTGIKFLPKNFIKCTNSGNDISKAIELSLNNFNFFVLAKQKSSHKKSDIHLGAVYKTQDLNDGNTSLGFTFYSKFFPSAYGLFDVNNKNYNAVYSGQILFLTESFYGDYAIELAGALSVPYSTKKISAAGKFEFNFFKDYLGFDTGFSLSQKDFYLPKSNSSAETQKEVLAFFVKPKFSFKLFKFNAVYNFSMDNVGSKLTHSGGFDFKVGNANYILKTALFYQKDVWETTANFSIKKLQPWQELFSIGAKVNCVDKQKNSYIIKNYSIGTEFKIAFSKKLKLGLSGKVSQKNMETTKKKMPKIIVWQKPIFEGEVYFTLLQKHKYFSHSFKAEIKALTSKPFFQLNLGYKLSK